MSDGSLPFGKDAKPELPKPEERRPLTKGTSKGAAARMLEECKTAFLEKRKNDLDPDLPDSHRERIVKASEEWRDYLVKMVRARTAANKAKINLEYVEMKGWENRSQEATKRAEMRLT